MSAHQRDIGRTVTPCSWNCITLTSYVDLSWLSACHSRESRREVDTGRIYPGPSLLKKKNSKHWKFARYSDNEFLSISHPHSLSPRWPIRVRYFPSQPPPKFPQFSVLASTRSTMHLMHTLFTSRQLKTMSSQSYGDHAPALTCYHFGAALRKVRELSLVHSSCRIEIS